MSDSSDISKLGRKKRETFLDKTFNRVLMEIACPILIIAMIGALVFFLIEIFYRGPHSARLGWVLGLFTIASVLVSRISIEAGIDRAVMFGLALATATFVVTVTLVDFDYGNLAILEPVVVLAFISTVMWCANRLTWDCTMIDESRAEGFKKEVLTQIRGGTCRGNLAGAKGSVCLVRQFVDAKHPRPVGVLFCCRCVSNFWIRTMVC